jgi:hypothetical protein
MKKKIAALVLGALLSVSAAAMAATPDAEMMSTQQEKAAAWVETMLVKNDPAASLKLMSAEAQKEIDAKKATAIHQDMDKNLGKYKGGRFVGWTRFDQADQMMYLLSFEKEPVVRCVFLFDKKGNLQNFALSPVKQTEEKKDEKKK